MVLVFVAILFRQCQTHNFEQRARNVTREVVHCCPFGQVQNECETSAGFNSGGMPQEQVKLQTILAARVRWRVGTATATLKHTKTMIGS